MKKTYQPIKGFPHTTPSQRKKTYNNMLRIILSYCGDVRGKRFLDVGSSFGYFCFGLTVEGAMTVGVEKGSKLISICRCLSKMYGFKRNNPLFLNMDVAEYLGKRRRFNYALLLNILHHIMKRDEAKGWRVFNALINASEAVIVMTRASYMDWKFVKTQREIGPAIVRRTDADWFKVLDRSMGRHVYAFGKRH